jgi:hypothetical protein
MALKFQEPPASKRTLWPDVFAELRSRPNEWALVKEASASQSTTTHIGRGLYAGSTSGEFEARSSKREDGKFDIYARYVGV